jgi:hypothetical protein
METVDGEGNGGGEEFGAFEEGPEENLPVVEAAFVF